MWQISEESSGRVTGTASKDLYSHRVLKSELAYQGAYGKGHGLEMHGDMDGARPQHVPGSIVRILSD